MICKDDFVKNRKKFWEWELCSEGQWKVKEIVWTMMKKSRKIKRNCENDDKKNKKEIELWEWWWSILISDSVVTAPSQAGPILTILSFVPFALIDDEESDCFEKDDDIMIEKEIVSNIDMR